MSFADLKYLVPGGPKLPTERGVALEDEQRKAKLDQFQELFNQDRISPIQLSQAIDDVYKDAAPEQRAGVFTRMFNKGKAKKQDDANATGRQQRSQEEQAILAGAKPPASAAPPAPKPAPETSDTRARADYTQFKKDHPEYEGSFEQWKTEQGAAGRAAGTPAKPAVPPKPGSPAVQFTNLLAKKLLADRKQGPPLTNEEEAQLQAAKSAMDEPGVSRAAAWATAAAKNNLIAVTDPTTGQDTLVPRAQAVAAAVKGTPYLAGAVSAPTGMDKKNQMLAQSALTQIDTMEKILDADPGLTGPGAGQWTAFNRWLGSNSEDSQQFLAAATFMSEHGVGVFGGRNIHSIEDLQGLMGSLKTNPKALKAALEQARQTMQPWATAGGRLPAPKAAQGGGGAAPIVQQSKKTGQYRYSTDGGKTWQPGQPPQK